MFIYWLSNLNMGASPSGTTAQSFRQAPLRQARLGPRGDGPGGRGDLPRCDPGDSRPGAGRAGPLLGDCVHLRGQVLAGSDGTSAARVSLRAWSDQLADVDGITSALFNGINGVPGVWGNGSCVILSVTQQDESDENEPPKAGTDQWQYSIVSEYLVRYRVPIPTLS